MNHLFKPKQELIDELKELQKKYNLNSLKKMDVGNKFRELAVKEKEEIQKGHSVYKESYCG